MIFKNLIITAYLINVKSDNRTSYIDIQRTGSQHVYMNGKSDILMYT